MKDLASRHPSAPGIALRFLAFFAVFIAGNLLAAHFMSDCGLPAALGLHTCYDDIVRAGWPFKFYEDGGFAHHSFFDTSMLAVDVLTGAVLSVAGSLLGTAFDRRPPRRDPQPS